MKKSLHLSYRQFARRRPFYVTEPKAKDRDTCACMDHENVHLLANKLYSRGLLKTKSISELLVMIQKIRHVWTVFVPSAAMRR